jgi:hypothetical protein
MRYIWIGIIFVLFSCGKEDPIVIDGNTPPPDSTIETVILENYVNKLYISMLGREPNAFELHDGLIVLGEEASESDRLTLVEQVQSNAEYYGNLFDTFRQDYLNGGDTTDIREQYIEVYAILIATESNPIILEIYEQDYQELVDLYNVSADLNNGSINVVEAHVRCVNNAAYDEINMGTENYVVSMFQNFLHRYPTLSELKNSSIMVEGEQAICFGVNGDSKNDFNNIFFEHDGYFEGQVITVYNKLLFRAPNSEEATFLANSYKLNKSYKDLQLALLVSNEFMGIE